MNIVRMTGPADGTARFPLAPRAGWTLIGLSAIPLWALWPLTAMISSASMPVFQVLAINFGAGAITLLALKSARPSVHMTAAGRGIWTSVWLSSVMFCLGSLISSIFFLWALRYIPPAQASLISYLWPLMVVALAAAIGQLVLRPRHLLSMVLGLLGAALVIGPGVAGGSLAGISLAVLSGLLWAIFCVFRAWQGQAAPDALTGGFALSAVVAAVIHLATETTTVPPLPHLLILLLNGSLSLGIGNLAWDLGFRRGDRALLAVAAYGTPLVSALILTGFGYAEPSIGLIAGGLLIFAGGAVSARS